jgi:archaemetzincin
VPAGICILDATGGRLDSSEDLVASVAAAFRVPVRWVERRLDPDRAYDAARGQHDATAMLQQVLASIEDASERHLAIVSVDLFIPVLTFVFGQAQLGGPAGLVSTHRLANEFYGLPRAPGLTRERIEKEVLHELGHQFGLFHCRQFECVMRSSTYVEEIDLKRAAFCESCGARLIETTRAA